MRAIIRISKSVILLSIPLGVAIAILMGELWLAKWLYGFFGGLPGQECQGATAVAILSGLGMIIGSIITSCILIGDEGCEAYRDLIVQALRGTQQINKDWWKI